jgi:hypothetical protein
MPVPMITAQLVDGAGLPLGIAGAPLPAFALSQDQTLKLKS